MTFFFIRAAGVLGILGAVLAFQCKKHRNVMLFKSMNELFFALQYLLLGAYTGCAMNIIGTIRNFVFLTEVERGKSTRVAQIVFCLIFFGIGLWTWNGAWSLFPIGAKLLTTIVYGVKNTRVIRFLTLPVNICWIIYNFHADSIEGVLCEALTAASVVLAIIRIDLLGREKKDKGNQPTNAG